MATLQLTLAILKPDIVARPHVVKEIKDIILQNRFLFVRSKVMHLNKEQAGSFYGEHKGKFFHNRLVTYMSGGPLSAHILAREDAIKHWRTLMGPTKVFKTIHEAPDTIRGRFGLTDTRNSTHGSDSPESAKKEINFFFPEFSFDGWHRNEALFQNANFDFDVERTIHVLDRAINLDVSFEERFWHKTDKLPMPPNS
ncbi:nucleoside diphosphate kinase 6-like [Lineus longissimus]|uniref:nucleoside diphosphate kinase 6-like n=1 Tax=Lineus longissimus TaxID=88925 RepID=UPI002B4F7E8D